MTSIYTGRCPGCSVIVAGYMPTGHRDDTLAAKVAERLECMEALDEFFAGGLIVAREDESDGVPLGRCRCQKPEPAGEV